MKGPRLLAVLALLASLLAGCSGGKGGAPAEGDGCDLEPVLCDPQHYLASHFCIQGDVRPRVYAPDTPGPDSQADPWKAGDWWTYRLTVDGRARETTLVYYEDIDFAQGIPQHYLVGTSSEEEAFDHALFSVNPMLGRIHRTLYSPHESGLHADMFNFPLCEGASWTTEFYATTFDLTARRTGVDLPGAGRDDLGFTISGSSGDGSTLTHTYSPRAKWFTDIDLDRADGLRVDMELLAFGSGKAGTYYFLRAQQDETLDLALVGQEGFTLPREDGGEGPYDTVGVWIDAQRVAGSGRAEVHLRDPDGRSVACVGFDGSGVGGDSPCPAGPLKAQAPFQAGDWRVTVEKQLGAIDQGTRIAGEMRVVSIYDRSGTV
jgi:hypothetical protein